MLAKSSFWLPSVAGFGDDPGDSGDNIDYAGADAADIPTVTQAPVAPPVTSQTPTPATASTASSSPWSTVGSAFSDIFGNLAKNILPGVVNKELGTNLPGQTPGIVGTTPAGAAHLPAASTAAKAGGSVLILGAIVIGAFLLLRKK